MRKLSLALVVVFLASPLTAAASAMLHASDSIAGVGLDVSLQGGDSSSNIDILLGTPDGKKHSFPAHTAADGSADIAIPGRYTEHAGTYSINALQNRNPITQPLQVTVAAETMDPWTSTIDVWTPRILADGHDTADIVVTVRDRYGNPLSGRPVAVVSSRSSDMVASLSTQTNTKGEQHFSLSAEQQGSAQLRAIDLLSGNTLIEGATVEAGNSAMGGHAVAPSYTPSYAPTSTYTANTLTNPRFYYGQVTSNFDIIAGFEVTAPATMQNGVQATKVTVRAIDRNGATVENYLGTVRFSSTDPDAILPNFGTYTFKDRDLGVKDFALALAFRSSGTHVFRVEDANDPRIGGEAEVLVSGGTAGGTNSIDITSHEEGDMVNSLDILIEGRGPRFANLIVQGGTEDAYGASDENGDFSIPITLNPGQRDFTIRVRDDAGRNDSGSLHLVLDQADPVIKSVRFVPDEAEEGESVLVVVESDPALAQVLMTVADTNLTDMRLEENGSQPGTYQAFFTAPASGYYQPMITVMDKAGNLADIQGTFTVGAESLPQVVNVRAQSRVEAVELEWDSLTEDVDGYRIYIGDSPTNFLYTLDTERAINKAVVRGLTPGQLYVFAVTALRGPAESEEKSEPVEAQVLGLTLEVLPENGALNVKWTSLSTGLPLSSFIIEYGVDETALTESRTLNGEIRDYTIRDLLNGITYFVRLTPITVTGDKLEELAATGQGSPSGSGFRPAARDDVPFDITTRPGGTLHSAPSNPESGIPPAAWMTAIALGLAGVFYRWKRRKKISGTDAFLQAVRAQYKR